MFPLDVLVKKRREIDALEAEWLAMVRAYDRCQDWRADGYGSAAAALRHACNMNHATAAAHVKLAARLEQLPHVADAFSQGALSRQHVYAIANAYTSERAPALDAIGPVLVDAAKDVTPSDLRSLVKHATDAIDGDGGATDDAATFARRQMYAAKTLDGMLDLAGRLDTESGEIVLTALDAEMRRDWPAGDPRTPTQRRADALVNICRRDLSRGETTTRGKPAQVVVVADLAAYSPTPDLVADVRNEAARMGKLSRATLERISCDCEITRVLMNGSSEVLDVGRGTRTVPTPVWKALVARDGGCVEPGCNAPWYDCEAHHIKPWSQGGETSLENLELRCHPDHRKAHERRPP